jgi:putative Holliday junction resolvase
VTSREGTVPDETSGEGRVLGLDLGEARIGVAISDEDRRVAVPLGTVRAGAPQDLRAISRIVSENGVSLVVVGHPLSLRGERGRQAANAEKFADALRALLPIPVVLHDERLSTAEAERGLREAGARGRRMREVVDRSAATVILQSFLGSRRG